MDEKNEKEKMNEEKEELLKERVFFYFAQLCRIPRQSGNEKAVSDFILNWALDQGLKAKQDAVNNVFIRKAASAGYEAAPPVMLQAHMDMVCEKNEGVNHDFTKDPIKWMIEGDLISTGGETTLGADNGIGVACAMAVLEDKTLAHPRLEVLFTVAEESDFTGAANFDTSWMESDRMINLDHASDKEILCGSCGGMDAVITLPIKPEKLKTGWKTCTVRIYGLKGGHSGEDIHRGRGNANLLLGRFLAAAENGLHTGFQPPEEEPAVWLYRGKQRPISAWGRPILRNCKSWRRNSRRCFGTNFRQPHPLSASQLQKPRQQNFRLLQRKLLI